MAFFALIFGCLILLLGFFKQCLCKIPCTNIIMNISGFGVQISMALVYVAWANKLCDNGGCYWGEGMTYNLLAQIFYAVSSCLVRCMREPRYERRKDDEPAPKAAPKEKTKAPKKTDNDKDPPENDNEEEIEEGLLDDDDK
jgi:hypothetical protein